MSLPSAEVGGAAAPQAGIMAQRWDGLRKLTRRLLRNPLSAAGLILSLAFLGMAIFTPLLLTIDPLAMEPANRLMPPDAVHWFGTDDGGRDVLARVLHGARWSLLTSLGILAIASILGTAIGLTAGYLGGWVDEILMRLTDMFLAFPALILAMAMAAAMGHGLVNAMLATSLVWWPWYARLVRGQALHLKNEVFVEAARVSGAGHLRIAIRHILRNCLTPIIVQMSLDVGYAILTLSSLSFIGLGAQPPTPEWGSMVSVGREYFLDQWWIVTFPGLAIFASVMAFNLLGDGLQESLSSTLRR
jgi:peptide/nickel transport system permease protein